MRCGIQVWHTFTVANLPIRDAGCMPPENIRLPSIIGQGGPEFLIYL